MYDREMRKDCPMRGNLGNCSPVGGFCMNAVSDEICEAVHNAYRHGYSDALLKKQEPIAPRIKQDCRGIKYTCGACGATLYTIFDTASAEYKIQNGRFCPECGRAVKFG